jgi:hypothetical protein
MNRLMTGLTAVAAGGAGVVVYRRVRQARAKDFGDGTDRWHSVTINRSPEELGPKPPPLDELGFPVEIRIRPAPGDRGTELAARVVSGADRERVRELRSALRSARSLAEVGEVLRPDSPATTEPTLTGAPLAYATRHGREEGRL